jgi:ABC-type uncharacterized transport system permease subunit
VTLELANWLFGATATIYLAASVLFILDLMGRGGKLARWAPTLVGLGVPLHASHIVVWSLVLRVCPVEGIHFALSVVSMFVCFAYVLARLRYKVDVVGAFVAPQALAFLLASRFAGSVANEPRLRSALLPFHVISNLLGIALFTLACAAAVAYLLQERRLKHKDLNRVERLPAVDALDRWEHTFLVAGFPLLTIGILTGTIWARDVAEGGFTFVARATLSYACWVLIGSVLLLRAAAGWRGRRAAFGTILGFGLAMLVLIVYLVRSVVGAGAVGVHA